MSKRTAIDEMTADRIIPPETDLSFILIVFKYCKILKFKFTNLIEQTQSLKLLKQVSQTEEAGQNKSPPPPILSLVTLKI